jgi:cytochrome b
MRPGAYIWDLPVRLSHWGLVLAIFGCYATTKLGWLPMDWHFWFGYAALGLVLFRLCWGLLGGEHARFGNFLRGPRAVLSHLRELFGTGYRPHVGHNPLGGWAALLLLLLIGLQAALGLFSSDEIQWYGPLSERVSTDSMQAASSWHRVLELWLLLLIGLHLAAIAFYTWVKHDALLPAMVHGRKSGFPESRRAPVWSAWLLVVLVVAAIWALLRFWPEGGGVLY